MGSGADFSPQLLGPLPVAGPFLDQGPAQPGQVAQLPDRLGRHERRPASRARSARSQPARSWVGQAHSSDLRQPPGLQHEEEQREVDPGRLHDHQIDAFDTQVVAQAEDVSDSSATAPGRIPSPRSWRYRPASTRIAPARLFSRRPGGAGNEPGKLTPRTSSSTRLTSA